jgi:hypothetical protein
VFEPNRAIYVQYAPSATFAPKVPFVLLSSNCSLQQLQKKSATGRLLENLVSLSFPHFAQNACLSTQPSVTTRAVCDAL